MKIAKEKNVGFHFLVRRCVVIEYFCELPVHHIKNIAVPFSLFSSDICEFSVVFKKKAMPVSVHLSPAICELLLSLTKNKSDALFSWANCELVMSSKKYSYALFGSAIFELLLNLKKINLCPFQFSYLSISVILKNNIAMPFSVGLLVNQCYLQLRLFFSQFCKLSFYDGRRSERKPKSELDKDKMENIEAQLVAPTEDSELGLEIRDIPNKGRGVVVGSHFTSCFQCLGSIADPGSGAFLLDPGSGMNIFSESLETPRAKNTYIL
jgi:hypothetical protein